MYVNIYVQLAQIYVLFNFLGRSIKATETIFSKLLSAQESYTRKLKSWRHCFAEEIDQIP